jgi:hypothetical protein
MGHGTLSLMGMMLIALLVGCSGDDAADGPCGCENTAAGTAVVSLECLCSDTHCPTYEEVAKVGQCLPANARSELTTGCGRLSVHYSHMFAASTWQFDAQTHELIGGTVSSDTGSGVCQASVYTSGNLVEVCEEATTCSLCEGDVDVCQVADDGTAVDDGVQICACDEETVSLECLCAFADCPSYDELAAVDDCQQETMISGCGEVAFTSRNRGGTSSWVFDAETRMLVGAQRVDDVAWGPCGRSRYATHDLGSSCDGETECSLCSGEENVCEL